MTTRLGGISFHDEDGFTGYARARHPYFTVYLRGVVTLLPRDSLFQNIYRYALPLPQHLLVCVVSGSVLPAL